MKYSTIPSFMPACNFAPGFFNLGSPSASAKGNPRIPASVPVETWGRHRRRVRQFIQFALDCAEDYFASTGEWWLCFQVMALKRRLGLRYWRLK